MNEEDVDEVVEQLEDFSSAPSKQEIREDAKELLLEYGVPVEQSVSTLKGRYSKQSGDNNNDTLVGEVKVSNISPGDRGLKLTGRLVKRNEKTVPVRDEDKDIVEGVIGDETGVVSFTSWDSSFAPEEGDVVSVGNAYAKEWNDAPQLQINEDTTVEIIDDSEAPEKEDIAKPVDVGLEEINSVFNARVTANIIDIQDRSGLVMRCTECNRVTESGECREHGKVETKEDLRIKAILDDGDKSVQAIFNKETTEDLTNISLEKAEEMAREAMDQTVVQRQISNEFIGTTVTVTGEMLGDNFLVNEVYEPDMRVEQRANQLDGRAQELMEVNQ